MKKRLLRICLSSCLLLLLCGGLFSFSFGKAKTVSTVSALDEDEEETVTSISAVTTRRFYVGDTINKNDIEVSDNLGNQITEFDFAYVDYQFTYEDAASGGEYTEKTFANSISYNDLTCSLSAYVRRSSSNIKENEIETIRYYNLNNSTQYVSFNNVDLGSGFLYSGCISSYDWKHIFINSLYKDRGIVTTASGGYIKSITLTITRGCNTDVLVYASDTPYASPTNLYYQDSQGTLVMRTRSTSTVKLYGEYRYFGIRSDSGAIYIEKIDVEYGDPYYAFTLSEYIMIEDTVGQCEDKGETKGKYSFAIDFFQNELSDNEKNRFMTSDLYVFAKARERLFAWARHLEKEIVYENNKYVVRPIYSNINSFIECDIKNTTGVVIILSSSFMCISGLLIFLKIKKKKHN